VIEFDSINDTKGDFNKFLRMKQKQFDTQYKKSCLAEIDGQWTVSMTYKIVNDENKQDVQLWHIDED